MKVTQATAVLVFLLLSLQSATAGEKSTIAGIVRNLDTGNAVWGALVTLKPTQKTAVTDKQGRFSVAGIRRGAYRITISLSGYETATQQVRCPDEDVEIWLLASEETVDREEIIITGKGRSARPPAVPRSPSTWSPTR